MFTFKATMKDLLFTLQLKSFTVEVKTFSPPLHTHTHTHIPPPIHTDTPNYKVFSISHLLLNR